MSTPNLSFVKLSTKKIVAIFLVLLGHLLIFFALWVSAPQLLIQKEDEMIVISFPINELSLPSKNINKVALALVKPIINSVQRNPLKLQKTRKKKQLKKTVKKMLAPNKTLVKNINMTNHSLIVKPKKSTGNKAATDSIALTKPSASIRVGNLCRTKKPPNYPSYARKKNISGSVLVSFQVNAAGKFNQLLASHFKGIPLAFHDDFNNEIVQVLKGYHCNKGLSLLTLEKLFSFNLE